MKAKFVYESLEDILRPKSRKEILDNIGGRDDLTFKKSKKSSSGTYLIGEINVSYDNLVKLFGEPQLKLKKDDDGYKTSTQWTLEDNEGRVYTIYDYKMTTLYGEDLTPEEFRKLPSYTWHIGGEEEEKPITNIMNIFHKTGGEDLVRYIYKNLVTDENLNEAIITPDKELFLELKKVFIEASKTEDPFTYINEKLNPLGIVIVDFEKMLETMPLEEKEMMKNANIDPELGIRFMGQDPDRDEIFLVVDESFDDKLIGIAPPMLDRALNRLWPGFGHETIHKEQIKRMKKLQNPTFTSREDYYKNKQEIMAMAFSFIQELSNYHSKNEIMGILKGDKIMLHPIHKSYKSIGGETYKLFLKYAIKYLEEL